jgi:GNAT superfamily N-acetyltransferase
VAKRFGDELARDHDLVCARSVADGRAGNRAIVLRGGAGVGAQLDAVYPRGEFVRVEDGFARTDLSAHGFTCDWQMSVMARPAGPPPGGAAAAGVRVERVADEIALGAAEQMIREGFPQPSATLPPLLLEVPGSGVWLARAAGEPVGAVLGFDDGASLGIYSLAVLPDHRGGGVARALMTTLLATASERPSVLTATAAGEPLYARLGYDVAGPAAWWSRGFSSAS